MMKKTTAKMDGDYNMLQIPPYGWILFVRNLGMAQRFYNFHERGVSSEDESVDNDYGLFPARRKKESINIRPTRAKYVYFSSISFLFISGTIRV